MNNLIKVTGQIEVYRVKNSIRELIYWKNNLVSTPLLNNLAQTMIQRSIEIGVDAIAWGSFKVAGGTFIDSDWAGTTSSGTKGALIQSRTLSVVKHSGTFSFSTTKQINMFRMGRGYTAAGAGVAELFTTLYNIDSSLLTGSTFLTYNNGDTLIVDWTNSIA